MIELSTRLLFLRQVDNCISACEDEDTAKEIFEIIGKQLQLRNEDKIPFAYLGLTVDFNGVDIEQSSTHIMISCQNYIERMLRAHSWESAPTKPYDYSDGKSPTPLPPTAIHHVFTQSGPPEGTAAAYALELKHGFAYRTLLGEMMYAYVTCRPDIGYAITTMSKFSTMPSTLHFHYLKYIAKYLRLTKDWGIRYKRTTERPTLDPPTYCNDVTLDENLPKFPVDINQPTLIAFVDAAYANDPRKRRSTTGFVFTYCGGAIVYRSKTQPIVALSSTEAEFIAAVACAKIARYLQSILTELGFHSANPTPIYEDNASTIMIINARVPTERTRHIDVRYFAIQDWKEEGSIEMLHIPGVINPADDLTKPLGWVLHARHARRFMGHYT